MPRKIVLACAAFVATLCLCAGTAGAKATANSSEWYAGPTESPATPLVGNRSVTAVITENPSTGSYFRFSTFVGSYEVQFKAKQLSCVECRITNELAGKVGTAAGSGKLLFSEVFFVSPSTCKLKEGKLLSRPLLFEANYVEGTKWLMKIGPQSGGDFYVEPEPVQPGANCILNNFGVVGSEFVEFQNKMGVFKTSQPFSFSPTVSAVAGSSWAVGENTFDVTGSGILGAGGYFFGAK